MTYILGISAYFHDSAAALISDGEIIAAAEEERFTRIKHDSSLPKNAIKYCLDEAKITPSQLDAVVFYEKPLVKFERILETIIEYAPTSFMSFIHGMPSWLNTKLFIPNKIDDLLGKDFIAPIYYTSHHESHASSAFFPSPFNEAVVLCVDAVGEWDTVSWGIGKKNKITIKEKMEFPHSLGMLYSAFTGFLGFKVNSGEYKVMGLAPYGKPIYTDLILNNMVDIKEDGSFKLNMEYFGYCNSEKMYSDKFCQLFKIQPRTPESRIDEIHMDIARSLQEVTEIIILKITDYIYSKTKLKNLCLAGGCALNCVANGKILKKTKFENIWVQPASNDAGGALGAALAIYYHHYKKQRVISLEDSQKGSLLGPNYNNNDVIKYLNLIGATYHLYDSYDEIAKNIAKNIAEGKIVGNFHGRLEFGPRALGNRSILADARNTNMQKKLNLAIKKRESFRPFAPSCLEEDAETYFDIHHSLYSPYMLITAEISEKIRKNSKNTTSYSGLDKLKKDISYLPAITHVDYSARLQTVSKKTNLHYWNIINEFKKITGYPIIVNTSFNVRGEPLVCSLIDAFKCFMNTDMDILVMEKCILYKKEQNVNELFYKNNNKIILD